MKLLCVGKLKCSLGICVLVALASAQVFAAEYTWTGNGASGNWSLADNWSGGAAPTNDGTGVLTFSSNANSYNPNNNNGGTFSLRKMVFSSGLPAIHHTGNAISFNMNTAGGGIYQNSANPVIIDNPLSWTGSNVFYINSQGTGGLTLTNNITGSGGTIATCLGSITYSTGTLSTGTNGKLYVGYSGPATLTVQGSATVNVGGELDVNYQATRSGDTSTLAISSGVLTVTGQTYVGRATMQGGASDYSAKILQTGGTTTFNNLISVGQNGTAKSLFDLSSGTANANAGLVVGNQGNGNLNIHGSGSLTVSNGSGLIIGQDSTLATGGMVEQSGGTLTVNGNISLGNNGGIGTLNRSGGTMSVTGNLIAGGTGSLIVNGTSASFGGTLSRPGAGTLLVVPSTGNLGSTENVSFSGATNGTLGPWAVRQTSASNSSGDYLKITGTGHSLATADYDSNPNFSGSTNSTTLENVNANCTIDSRTVYALKIGAATPPTLTINSGQTLSAAGGGIILNGGTVSGGTIAFSDGVSDKMALLYAGTNTPGTISSVLKTNAGLIKFGAGTLNLSSASGDLLQGAVMINQGTLNVRDSAALGASGEGNGVTLAAGAALELQGNISVYKTLTLNGSGVGNAGAMRNVQDNNSWTGEVNLASPSQINTVSGQLTLNGQISGNYGLTKTGTGTLALYADNSAFLGTLTVANGILTVQNANSLGSYAAASGTTINSGATLAIQGNIAVAAEPLTISGTGIGNIGAIKNTQGTNSFAGPITLAADSLININADSLNLSGRIGGNFNLTKAGSGALTLSNTTNQFSGTVTVSEGALNIVSINNAGVTGTLGSGTAPVVLGSSGKTGTLFYTGASANSNRQFTVAASGTGAFQINEILTLSDAIGGSGVLQKTGSGTLTLTAANSGFTGSTTVHEGTLVIDAGGAPQGTLDNTSDISIHAGATLNVIAGGTTGLLNQLPNTANISISGGNFEYVGDGTFNGGEVVGTLVLNAGQNNISASRQGGSTYTPYLRFSNGPASHATGATVNFSATNSLIQFQNSPPGPGDGNIIGGYAFFNNVDFATRTTTSPYTVSAYSSYATGDLGTRATDVTINVKPSGTQSAFNGSKQFNSLNLTGALGANLNGYTLTLNSGGLIANTSGTMSGGTIKGSSGGELVINSVQDFTLGSVIANNTTATALVKTGTGKLTLTGLNTFTGNTYLNQGILEYAPTSDLSYGQVISGVGNLLKTGGTTLTLTGNNTYTGTTTINAGRLQVNGSLASGSTVTIGGGTLGGTGTVYGTTILNTGAIDFSSSGLINSTLTANGGSWLGIGGVAGRTTVASGTLTIGDSTHAGNLTANGDFEVAGSATVATGNSGATITGNFIYSSSANQNFSGTIAGAGKTVTMNNSTSALTLSHANTYSGGTDVTAGTLKVGNISALGSGGLHVGANGIFDLNGIDIKDENSNSLPWLTGDAGGVIKDSTASAGTTTLTVDIDSGESIYDGTFQDNSTRKLLLTKTGSGSLVLGSVDLNGDLAVTGGTLTAESITCNTLTIGAGSKVVIEAISGGPLSSGSFQPLAGGNNLTSVPEPGSLTLLFIGSAAYYFFLRRQSWIGNKQEGHLP